MKTLVFEINSGYSEAAIVRVITELNKLSVESHMVREDTYRLLIVKIKKNTSIDSVIYICQLILNTLNI